jgi:hypothetical protein
MEPARVPPEVLRTLLMLASATFQERYMHHPQAEEYVDPDNVLGEVIGIEQWLPRSPVVGARRAAVYRFLAVATAQMDDVDAAGLADDPAWGAIRSAARSVLEDLGHGQRLALMDSGDLVAAMEP